ncbi:hypothetical protein AB0J86_32845 [Micromonospora sp. NPDC049559]|uniref:hypothetical protein n=1 Tax=Micromonospora sp. NPDC049559 TaxID=3155923 RepID=UPI003444885B
MTDPRRPVGVRDTPVRAAGDPAGRERPAGVGDRLAALFDPVPPGETGDRGRAGRRRAVPLALAAVLAATAVSLGRVGGPGPFNTVWAEDATDFLTGALNRPATSTILLPVNGYFLVVPRLLSEAAALVPVAWAPAALTTSAALCAAALGLLVYHAAAATLPHPLARAVVAGGVVAAPVGENNFTNVLNSVAPLQFPMLFALFWCALWAPRRRLVRAVQVGVVGLCAVSTFLAVVFIPLALLRLGLRRDRLSAALLAAFLAGAALQAYGLLAGVSTRGDISHPRIDPLWALRSFVTWAVPFGLFGPEGVPGAGTTGNGLTHTGSGSGAGYLAAVAGAWLLVGAAVLVAARGRTRPAWSLAGVAGAHALGILALEVMVQGELVLRYVFPCSLLLVTALVALLLPRPDRPRARAALPLLAFTLVLLVAAAANYRLPTLRTRSAPWDVKVAEARAYCAAHPGAGSARVRMLAPYPWSVRIPCRRLG